MSEVRIYLDHNATTPVDPAVLEVMLPYFTEIFGNAASIDHDFGYEANKAVDAARVQISSAINANPDEIIFTSGATESDNTALFGIVEKYKTKGDHVITCVTEHKAILDSCKRLEKIGKHITYLLVDSFGRINIDELRKSITPKTILISIMAANNEIGTLASLAEIGVIAREHGVLFHTDAAQAFGHIPIDVQKMNIDIMSMSAHKIYGPKGIGCLYRRRSNPRVLLQPIIYGGGHEHGIRSGTLNVPGIVGFGKAIDLACKRMSKDEEQYKKWTNYMYQRIQSEVESVEFNGHPTERLSYNLNVSFNGIESKALIVMLKGIAVSAGSACTTASMEPSHVIKALGFGDERAHSSIRISVGRFNDDKQIQMATEEIISCVNKLRHAF